jgi:hypothetical protein
MNILLTNEWGARLVTCERHEAARTKYLGGDKQRTETPDECPDCRTERLRAELPLRVREALLSPDLSHTRARNVCGATVCVYHYDRKSPTGVMLAVMCDEEMYDAIAAELRGQAYAGALSPLSPTEAR